MVFNLQRIHRAIFTISLLLVVGTLPFYYIPFNSMCIILLALNWIVDKKCLVNLPKALKNPMVLSMAGVFLLHVLGMAYTHNIPVGLSELEKKLSFLLLPLILFTSPYLSARLVRLALLSFVLVCLFVAIRALLGVALLTSEEWKDFYIYTGYDYRMALRHFIKIDPTYFSIYLIFSIYGLVYLWLNGIWLTSKLAKAGAVFTMAVFLGTLFLLIARLPIIALFVTVVLGIVYYFYRKKQLGMGLAYIGLLVVLSAVVAWNTYSIRYRIEELFQTKYVPPRGLETTSTNIRVALWECSKQVIRENGWLMGVGTGDFQDAMNACYQSKGFSEVLYKDNYNSHNQYLQTLISLGLPGLMVLLSSMILPFIQAYRDNNYLHLAFLVLLLLCCLTESIMERNKGLIFFVLFNILLNSNLLLKDQPIFDESRVL